MTTNGHESAVPLPIPELDIGGPVPSVTDEDRNRFGALLDAAAERGLLSPADYQARLVEVAEAGTTAELQRIVTELPAFGGGPTADPSAAAAPVDVDAALWAGRTQPVARRDRGNQWLVLAVVVGVLVVALVALGLVAAHLVHAHDSGSSAVVGVRLSSLRL